MVFAKILAQVVFPTPLGPQNRKACARCWFLIAFFKVVVICCCPTTLLKLEGLYFLAETTKFSIAARYKIIPNPAGQIRDNHQQSDKETGPRIYRLMEIPVFSV